MADLDLGDFLYVLSYLLGTLACNFLLMVIRRYHERKPLGMQTFNGRMIASVTKVLAVIFSFLNCTFCAIEIIGPFPQLVSLFWSFLLTMCAVCYNIGFTKYLTVYHGSIINDIDEEKIAKRSQKCLILVSLFLTLVEYLCLTSYRDIGVYQLLHLGHAKESSKLEQIISVLVMANFVSAFVLYCRIEYGAVMAFDVHSGYLSKLVLKWKQSLDDNQNSEGPRVQFGYNIDVVRVCGLCGIVMLALTFFGQGDMQRWSFLIHGMFFNVVIPLLFVLQKDRMRSTAIAHFRKSTLL